MTNEEARQLREVIREETRPLRELIESNHGQMRAEFAAGRTEIATGLADTRDTLRAEMAAASAETRRHFDVVAEDLRGGIKLLAEGHSALGEKIEAVDRRVTRVEERVESVDLRVMWLQERSNEAR